VTAKLALRKYQHEALDALHAGWDDGLLRLAVVLPTGLGKTVIFAELCRDAVAQGQKPVILVHREELAQQAADKLRSVDPSLRVGIVKAERREYDADVLVCSVPTVARDARMVELIRHLPPVPRRLIVVDECHHAAAPTWVRALQDLGAFDGAQTAGFTATMTREDSRHLGDVWQKIVYSRDILFGIRHNPPYLTDVKGKRVTVDDFDLASVAKSRGDYQEGALGEALLSSGAGEIIAESYVEHAKDRPGVLFAPTVQTAQLFAEDMNDAGIPTETIIGTTPNEERQEIFARHREGKTQVLSNCMVLTEGWDAPHTSAAIIARPTQAAGLYVQMVGRILRPYPGKADALVLDVVGATAMHALKTIATLTESKVPTIEDGETLAEAVARHDAEEEAREAGRPADAVRAAGELAVTDVDLFHGSSSVWLQTYAGTWFIPTRDWTFFLWPENGGLFKLGRKPTWRNSKVKGGWLREGLDLGYAMAIGEAEAAETDVSISKKTASWRRKSNKPSEPQRAECVRLKLVIPEGANRAEVSDIISIHYASRDLDIRRK
jgi:superfamily II DNA or RNA helicase